MSLVQQRGCTTSPCSLIVLWNSSSFVEYITPQTFVLGRRHPLVQQQGCTTSPQSYNPVELLVPASYIVQIVSIGTRHPPVQQQVCTTSAQSYRPAEHLVLCRTSNPDCTGQWHSPVRQQVCTASPAVLWFCGTPFPLRYISPRLYWAVACPCSARGVQLRRAVAKSPLLYAVLYPF